MYGTQWYEFGSFFLQSPFTTLLMNLSACGLQLLAEYLYYVCHVIEDKKRIKAGTAQNIRSAMKDFWTSIDFTGEWRVDTFPDGRCFTQGNPTTAPRAQRMVKALNNKDRSSATNRARPFRYQDFVAIADWIESDVCKWDILFKMQFLSFVSLSYYCWFRINEGTNIKFEDLDLFHTLVNPSTEEEVLVPKLNLVYR